MSFGNDFRELVCFTWVVKCAQIIIFPSYLINVCDVYNFCHLIFFVSLTRALSIFFNTLKEPVWVDWFSLFSISAISVLIFSTSFYLLLFFFHLLCSSFSSIVFTTVSSEPDNNNIWATFLVWLILIDDEFYSIYKMPPNWRR